MLLSLTIDGKSYFHINELNSSLQYEARSFIDRTEKTKAISVGFLFYEALETLAARQIEEEVIHTSLTEVNEPSKFDQVTSFSIWVYDFLGGL